MGIKYKREQKIRIVRMETHFQMVLIEIKIFQEPSFENEVVELGESRNLLIDLAIFLIELRPFICCVDDYVFNLENGQTLRSHI